MRYGLIAAGTLVAGLCFANVAQAAEVPRIGVVNLQAVIGKSHRGQAAQEQLTQLANKLKASVQDRRQKLQVLKQQLAKADSKSDEYAKLQKNFQSAASDYQQFVAANQQDLEERKQELLQPIEQELEQVLNSFAKSNHYDILLSHSAAGAVYVTDKYDVTTSMIDAMNKDWAQQQQSQAKPDNKTGDKNGKG
ncbi:MAG TPA: OmpH family outer membrane protein [Gammaproteobacteria bacterium]|nr:OmpH family outer membrane protein [Gammaproteobacteria bacterium]